MSTRNSGQKQAGEKNQEERALLVLESFVGTAHRFTGMGNFAFGYGEDYRRKEVEEGLEQRQR